MNRRNFFRTMVGGVAAAAAVRTFPFRVFSFPSDVTLARSQEIILTQYLEPAIAQVVADMDASIVGAWKFEAVFPVNEIVQVRYPQRFVKSMRGELGECFGFEAVNA